MFKKERKCNTCNGFGALVRNPCGTCSGQGFVSSESKKQIHIQRFIENNEELQYKFEGHQSIYKKQKGEHGDLKIKIQINESPKLNRDGVDVHSLHHITLNDALNGGNY